MRISQDDSSWKARGILRRDFKHVHDEPEITKYKVKKRAKKARKKIDHKHVWIREAERTYDKWERRWWIEMFGRDPGEKPTPCPSIRFTCSICKTYKYKKNPRYGYENWKWRKNNRR